MTVPSGDAPSASLNDALQRRVFLGMALLAALVQAVTLAYMWGQGSPRLSQGVTSLVCSVLLVGLMVWPGLALRVMQRVVVGVVCGLFLLNLLSVYTTGRPITSGLLIHLVILALFSFTWLPPRVAAALLGGSYIALAGAAAMSHLPDVPGVLLVGFVLPLVWYLTLHGREVSRERGQSELLRTLAYRDPLTGVHNRRAGSEFLKMLLDDPNPHVDTGSRPEVAVGVIDLDHFKRINDTLGHQQGDRVLVAVADSLATSFSPHGTVVRWGGEEFLVILSGQSRASVRQQIDAALDAVRALQLGDLPAITISAGLAFSGETRDPVALLDLADGRLYQAKAAGRDRAH